ncbi:MAG: Bacterial extracellular solute-binding proteins, family 5 Middle [Tenericutes bacterium ADurb.Bin087]|nr:MAG: Bacterial extracellular solute-binding proteins, family 5 Middle [Tenericutes bacterium ADurb.Bin087]
MKNKKQLFVLGLIGLVALSGCKQKPSSSQVPASSETPTSTVTSSEVPPSSEEPDLTPYVTGVRTFAGEKPASIQARKDILTKLETYVQDTFIGGIPYRDNSGIVLYHEALQIPADDYVVGYGFGVGEGTITAPLTGDGIDPQRNMYFHTWLAEDPATINYMDSQMSTTGDLYSMISTGYWGTRFNADKTGYEWYPLLADDEAERPIPLNFDENTGTATKWKVPLKVGGGLVYDTLSADNAAFKGRPVAIEDYLTPFKLMLEQGWFRATDLAAATGGFVGVADELAKPIGERDINKVAGIKLLAEENAMQFEFNSAKSPFYAMYNLASSLFSPIPMAFIDHIGAVNYGKSNINSVLSTGVYTLEEWEVGKRVVFKKNPTHIESDRYSHEGYIYTQLKDENVAFDEFLNGKLHGAGVPAAKLLQYKSDPRARQTKGDVTWKLQVNAADEVFWNELFGPEGSIAPGAEWELKPVMSNRDFLNGVYYAINREAIAEARGSRPAQTYLSEAYMIDPESGMSWRASEEGKAVVADRSPETFGYDKEAAGQLFVQAMNDLVAEGKYVRGTKTNPTVISPQIHFFRTSQIEAEGRPLAEMIQDAFNSAVEGFKLEFELFTTEDPENTYDAMQFGEFDFAFGTIGGNPLDPVGFMDVCRSDNRSGFTLSWALDTGKAYPEGHLAALEFQGEYYSYDALLESTAGLTIIKDGEVVPAFTFDVLSVTANPDDETKFDLRASGTYYIDPAGELVVEADLEGTATETGAFFLIALFEMTSPYPFVGAFQAQPKVWADGEWSLEIIGITPPAANYYADLYVHLKTTYKGTPEYSAVYVGGTTTAKLFPAA